MTQKQLASAQVARAIAKVMEEKGWNQADVARAMGLGKQSNTLADVLNKGRNTTVDWLNRFAEATGQELVVSFRPVGSGAELEQKRGLLVASVSRQIQEELHRLVSALSA